MQEFRVGETYAFVTPELRKQYGEWKVSEIRNDMVYAARAGEIAAPMVMNNAVATYWTPGAYFCCELIADEPVIEEDWS